MSAVCQKCQKSITTNHRYRLVEGKIEHQDCDNPFGKEVKMNAVKGKNVEFTLKPSIG